MKVLYYTFLSSVSNIYVPEKLKMKMLLQAVRHEIDQLLDKNET